MFLDIGVVAVVTIGITICETKDGERDDADLSEDAAVTPSPFTDKDKGDAVVDKDNNDCCCCCCCCIGIGTATETCPIPASD